MTAVFTASGLGLFDSSADTLGQSGLLGNAGLGQSGERAFVNAATGNLVIRQVDEILVGQGIDAALTRTYNSQGGMTDGNADDWVLSATRSLAFSGTLNTVGSTVTRRGSDGSITVFQYDSTAGQYASTAGSGAHDTIAYNAANNRWEWFENSGLQNEEYDTNGRLLTAEDSDGNRSNYLYDVDTGDLSEIEMADAGGISQQIIFDYSNSLVSSLRVISDGTTTTRVSYGYDASQRLSTVSVDLTPEVGGDSNNFVTTYTYEGTSTRIDTITQSDGSSLTFDYVLDGGTYRVSSVINAAQEETTYLYGQSDASGNYTLITAPTGATTKVYSDASGRMVRLEAPAVNGQRTTLTYAYDSEDNLLSITDGAGNQTVYTYDTNGNRLSSQDSLGNRTEWTYTATNQVATSTAFVTPDPDGAGVQVATDPLTTRWVYDAEDHITHIVGASGDVTRYDYDAVGNRILQQVFRSGTYDVSSLNSDVVPSAAALDAWISTQNLANTQRIDYGYDFRGQLDSMTEWREVDATGAGVTGSDSITRYVYDQSGKLLKQISARGEDTVEEDYVSLFTYDGLSRITSTTAPEGQSVTTTYSDSVTGTTVNTTTSAGLVTVSTFDVAGRLISVDRSDGGGGDFGESRFTYQDGFLRSTLSSAGGRSYSFYDAAGRLQYAVDETGAVSETVYDSLGRVASQTSYATAAITTTWYDSSNDAVTLTTAAFEAGFKPAANPALDRTATNTYDNGGRLLTSTDGTLRTTYTYDGLSRLTQESSGALDDSGQTRTTHFYYDDASRQIAVIDAEGSLTENRYDAAGRLIEQVSYANPIAEVTRSQPVDTILSGLTTDADDQSTHYYYDDRNQLIGTVDAERFLTSYAYNDDGNRTSVTRFATKLTGVALASDVLPTIAVSSDDQTSTLIYDQSGRLMQTTNHQGNIEAYTYDDNDNVVRINQYSTTPGGEIRRTFMRYDEAGQLTGELSAEEASALTDTSTAAAVDAAIATSGIQRIYDPAGRLIQLTDQVGNDVWFYYDERGQVRYSVNGEGEVLESKYNVFGEVSERIAYANRVDTATLAGGGNVASLAALITPDSANDRVTQFEFDERGLLARQISRVLNSQDVIQDLVTDYEYSVWGQVSETIRDASYDGLVRTTNAFTYDLTGRELTTTVAVGADSRTQTSEYDAFGRVVRQWDALGRLSEFDYDKNGRAVDITDPLLRNQHTTYDAFGRTLTVRDALLRETVFDYDDAARETTVTLPGNVTTISRQNEFGETIEVVDAELVSTVFDYDQNGNLKTTTTNVDGQDQTVTNDYDAANRLIRTTDAGGRVVAYNYDAANRLINQTTDPDGSPLTSTIQYSAFGEQIRVTDAGLRATAFTFDVSGQLRERTVDPDGAALTTRFDYDARGRQVSIVSAAGNVTDFVYNDFGQLTNKIVDPLGLNISTQYEYDDAGNMTKRIDALGAQTFYVYDDANRLQHTLEEVGNGKGYITETVYDDLDRVVATHRYADRFDLPTGGADPVVDTGSSDYESLWNTYDDAGRLAFSINEENYVTGYVYDDNGRLVQNNRYSAPITTPAAATAASLQASLPTAIATTTISYDELGRERVLQEADGSVTEFRYDFSGNIVESVLPDTVSSSRFFYDQAGRKRYELDALGNLVRLVQDNSGDLILRQVFAASAIADVSGASSAEAVEGLLGTILTGSDNGTNTALRSEFLIYDDAGRLRFSVDALGQIAEQVYDADGRVVETLRHSGELSTVTVSTTVADIEALLATPPPADPPARSMHYVFDADGRARFTVDSLDRVTEQEYDDAGNLLRQIRYAAAYGNLDYAESSLEAFAVSQPGTAYRETVFEYDALGRTEKMTNALGQEETYEYDAYGNRTAFINKANNRWEYEYDGVGNLTEERSAQETFYRTDITTDPANPVTTSHVGYQITSMEYDYRGNVKTLTEGVIRSLALADDEAQKYVTTFGYDAVGRQTGISYVVGEGAGTPVSVTTRYDAFGNAVANRDVRGNLSYKVYDTLGRERFDIDAEGYVTENRYDAFGNLVTLVRYAAQQAQLLVDIDTVYTEAAMEALVGPIADPGSDRLLSHEYDAAGQRVRTIASAVAAFDTESGVEYTSSPETLYTYNSYGELWLEQRLVSRVGGTPVWAETYRYYNGDGQVTSEVNAGGYLTQTSYNSYGEVFQTKDYARAIGDTSGLVAANKDSDIDSAYIPVVSIDTDALIGVDRTREFEYDALGRVSDEYMLQVSYSSYDGSTLKTDHVDSRLRLVSTEYDAVGNVSKLTDTVGNTLETGFNALGHAIWTKEAARKVLLSVEAGVANGIDHNVGFDISSNSFSTRTPLTTYQYDVFGNVLVDTAHANGASGAATTALASSDDKITYYRYDTSRRKVEELDAEGNSTEFVYDVAGNITAETRDYRGAKGASDPLYTAETRFVYDSLGRQITTEIYLGSANQMTHAAVSNQKIEVAYNAFGEVVNRGTDRAAFEESFTYDNGGRLVQTPSQTGATVNYTYDLLGNLTREQSEASGDSHYHYDKLSRGVRVDRPIVLQNYNNSAGVYTGGTTILEYDRWGNVVGQTERSVQWDDLDASPTEIYQNRWEFNYNQFDQVTKEVQPETNVVGEDGAESEMAPEVLRYYDILGRQIAEQDTRGNTRFKVYNNANQVVEDINALGDSTRYAYDVFGRQVAKQNANNYITTTEYDRLDQAVRIGDIRYDSTLTDSYNQQLIAHTYNALGHQVSTTHSQSIDTAGVVRTATSYSDYDVRGNLIRTESATGLIVRYAYDSQGHRTLQSNGLAGTGSAGEHELSWAYDYFGRVQSYNNLGGIEYAFVYNPDSGQLVYKGTLAQLSGYENGNITGGTTYEYYSNGALKRFQDHDATSGGLIAEYEYDHAGRRIYESASGSDKLNNTYSQITRTEYDEHGRIYRVLTTDLLQGGDGLDTLEAIYGYDEAGNRRYVKVSSQYSSTYVPPTTNAPTVNTSATLSEPSVSELATQRHYLGSDLFSDVDGDSLSYFAEVEIYTEIVLPFSGGPVRVPVGGQPLPSWVTLDVVKGATDEFYLDFDAPPLTASEVSDHSLSSTPGEYRIQLHARDWTGAEAIRSFNINILDWVQPNDPPVVGTPMPDVTATEGQDVGFSIPATAFTDPDGHDLRYVATIVTTEIEIVNPGGAEPEIVEYEVENALPSWLLLNETSGVFSGIRTGIVADELLSIRVRVEETDTQQLYSSPAQDFVLTIEATNDAPVLSNPLPASYLVVPGESFSQPVSASVFTDPNGDSLTVTASGMPGWLSFNSGTLTFSGTPQTSDAGTTTVTLTATDPDGLTATTVVDIVVNTPPVASVISTKTPQVTRPFSYNIASSFSDADGDALTFSAQWLQVTFDDGIPNAEFVPLPSWMSLSAAGVLSGTPPLSAQGGDHVIIVTASDGLTTVEGGFTLIPSAYVNQAPTAGAGSLANQTVNEAASRSYTFPSNAFSDPDGHALTYTATVGGVATTSLGWANLSGRTFTFNPGYSQAGSYTVAITARDTYGATHTRTFTLSVNNTNRAPTVANAIPNQSGVVGAAWSYVIPTSTFTDPDGTTPTISVTSKPSWMSYNASTRTLSGTPPSAATWNVTVRGSDGSLTVTDTFSVTTTLNNAPVLNSPPASSYAGTVGTALVIDLPSNVFTDPNGDAITYSATGLPSWMSFAPSTVRFTGTPPAGQGGVSTITLTATDVYGASSSTSFQVRVNTPPVASTISAKTPQVLRPFSYNIASSFSDADGDALTFSATSLVVVVVDGVPDAEEIPLPSWMSLSAAGVLSGTPPSSAQGTEYIIVVTASDGLTTVEGGLTLTPSAYVNQAPTAGSGSLTNQAVNEAASRSYTFPSNAFSDPDGHALTYTATVGGVATTSLSWANLSGRTFTFNPGYSQAGSYTVAVTARDTYGATHTRTFTLTVNNVNRAPTVANAIPNQSGVAGAAWSYVIPSNTFTDPDGTTPTISVTSKPSWMSYNAGTRTLSGTPPSAATWNVTVRGSDGSLTVTDTFSVTVTANSAPVLNSPPASSYVGTIGTAFVVDLPSNVFTDPNGDAITYSASGLPSWMSFTPSTVRFTGTPPAGQGGVSTITLTATDVYGASSSTSFQVRVNTPPVVSTISNKTPQVLRPFSYNIGASFSDADGDALTFSAQWLQLDFVDGVPTAEFVPLPSWMSMSASGVLSGTPPSSAQGGDHVIMVTASDGLTTVQGGFTLIPSAYVNQAPTVGAGSLANQTVNEAASRSYTFPSNAFSDPDGHALTYTATVGGVATTSLGWANLSGRTFTFNPGYSQAGTYTVAVIARDPYGATRTRTFTLTVNNVNRAPTVANAIPNQSASAGAAWSYVIPSNTFTDPDGTTPAISVTSKPSWMSYNASTRTLSGTPPSAATWNVTVRGSDGSLTVNDTFSVTATAAPPNNAPVFTSGILHDAFFSGDYVSINVGALASDSDGDTLTFSSNNLGPSLSLNPSTGVVSGYPWNQDHFFTVTASDGQLTASKSVQLHFIDFEFPFFGFGANSTSSLSSGRSSSFAAPKSTGALAAPDGLSPVGATSSSATSFSPGSIYNPYDLVWDPDSIYLDGDYSIYINGSDIVETQREYWYTYDAENRIKIAEGVLDTSGSTNVIGIDETQGQYLDYDAVGNQILRVAYDGTELRAEAFRYNELGQLIESQSALDAASTTTWTDEAARLGAYANPALWQTETRYRYDLAGRIEAQVEYFLEGATREGGLGPLEDIPLTFPIDVSGSVKSATRTYYDDEGRVSKVENLAIADGYWQSYIPDDFDYFVASVEESDLIIVSEVLYNPGDYDAAGNITGYQYHKISDAGGGSDPVRGEYTITYSYTYEKYDTYQVSIVSGTGDNTDQKDGTTTSTYDASGRLRQVVEDYDIIGFNEENHRYFRYNGDGQIIYKVGGTYDTATQVFTPESDGSDQRHYYFSGGNQLGSVDGRGRIFFEDQAAYQIVKSGTARNAQNYTARDGDTLRSIARVVYGSESLWYVIADANGLSDDTERLRDGQSLRIPAFSSAVNDADSFKAYNAEEVIGDRTPAVPYVPPPPSADKGCGVIGQIIMIVVAIVVTVYTAGALSGGAQAAVAATGTTAAVPAVSVFQAGAVALAGGGATAAGSIGLGAAIGASFVGGVAGSIASQLVGKALGVVESFSLRSALASGLTSAASAGIGGATGLSKGISGALKDGKGATLFRLRAVKGAASYLSAQAAQVVVGGQRSSFSWAGVAAAGLGSAVGGAVGDRVGESFGKAFGGQFATGLTAGVASAAVSKALGVTGKIELQAIAVDAFANTVANSIIDRVDATPAEEQVPDDEPQTPPAPPTISDDLDRVIEEKLNSTLQEFNDTRAERADELVVAAANRQNVGNREPGHTLAGPPTSEGLDNINARIDARLAAYVPPEEVVVSPEALVSEGAAPIEQSDIVAEQAQLGLDSGASDAEGPLNFVVNPLTGDIFYPGLTPSLSDSWQALWGNVGDFFRDTRPGFKASLQANTEFTLDLALEDPQALWAMSMASGGYNTDPVGNALAAEYLGGFLTDSFAGISDFIGDPFTPIFSAIGATGSYLNDANLAAGGEFGLLHISAPGIVDAAQVRSSDANAQIAEAFDNYFTGVGNSFATGDYFELGSQTGPLLAGGTYFGLSRLGRVGTIDLDIEWGRGIGKQGFAYEDYLASILPAASRLPANFKTFDFFDNISGLATSAKTLDTGTAARLAKPEQIYSTLKRNIDAAADFETYTIKGVTLDSADIVAREIRLAVPSATNATQWDQLRRAVEYASTRDIDLIIDQTR